MLNYIPDMNRLKTFYVVFRCGSITAAALQLHVTKSAISQTIKLLEDEIKESLFVLKGRTLTPTQAARNLFETIEPYLLLLEQTFSRDRSSKGPSGLLRISAPPVFWLKYLLPAIAGFHRLYPKVRYQLHLTAFTTPLGQLEDDHIDFCIIDSLEIMYGSRNYFHVTELLTDPEYIVCSSRYWDKHFKDEPSYDQLIECNFISYHPQGAEVCEWFKMSFKRSPEILEPILTVDRADAVLYAVQKDMGLGLVPLSLVQKQLKDKSIIIIGGKKYPYHNSMVIVRLERKKMSPAQALFIEYLEKAVKENS
jgi:DNA-binding transcriptional LysR family regulator